MLRIQLHTLEKIKEAAVLDGIAEYDKRLSRFCRFKVSMGAFKLWKAIRTNGFIGNTSTRPLVVFTTGQGTLPSEGLADLLAELAVSGYSDIDMVVDLDTEVPGLPVSQEISAPIHVIPLTAAITDKGLFTLLVVEQVYRAFKILGGEAYHK